METLISRRFSVEQCRIHFSSLFIFEDNVERVGMGGQAIIREQLNAIGIATKLSIHEYFTDLAYAENCRIIDQDIENIKAYAKEKDFKVYVFPQMGLGTGPADMPRKCPKTFCYLTMRLLDEFQFNNVEFLKSSAV